MTEDEVIDTIDDAPDDSNCKMTIWLAPLNIIIDDANVKYAPKPNSIPKGTTGNIKGRIS